MNIIQGNVLVQVINMLINDHTCYSQQVGLIKKQILKILSLEWQNFRKILTPTYVYEKKSLHINIRQLPILLSKYLLMAIKTHNVISLRIS